MKTSNFDKITYEEVISSLKRDFALRESILTKEAVNFSGNVDLPIHRWFYYKEAFSSRLITGFISELPQKKNLKILDPFSGVGTTLLESKFSEIESVGFDINPVADFICKVKCSNYSENDIKFAEKYFQTFNENVELSENIPPYKMFDELFSHGVRSDMLKIKGFYERCINKKISSLIKLVYLSLIGKYANRIKDGNGLKIRKNYNPPESILPIFLETLYSFYEDLISTNASGISKRFEPRNIQGSIIEEDKFSKIKNELFDGVIFSPPYPNCFDYLEVYKLELWLGDFITSFKDLRPMRDVMVRSAVNCMFNVEVENSYEEVEYLAYRLERAGVWNERIPAMLRGYYDDMAKVLKRIYSVTRKGAPVHIIVANSCYKEFIIPTDAIFCRIAADIGFEVIGIDRVRQIRASSQQMKLIGNDAELMRESIVKLKR